jgi:hypothetical protein
MLLEVGENIFDLLAHRGQVWEDGVATKEELYTVMQDVGSDIGGLIVSIFGL